MGSRRKTDEQWIELFRDKFGNKFTYGTTKKVGHTLKIEVICKEHGVSLQDRHFHFKDSLGCPGCRDQRSLENLIGKFEKKHGDKFEYHKTKYSGYKSESIVTCKLHGDFKTVLSDVSKIKYPCLECRSMVRNFTSVKVGLEDFIQQCEYNEEKYDVDFTRYKTKTQGKLIVKCKDHEGVTVIDPPRDILSRTTPCDKCSEKIRASKRVMSVDELLERLTKEYSGRYTYDTTGYSKLTDNLRIFCKIHGWFEKSAANHLYGVGCTECTYDKARADGVWVGGYSKELFRGNPELATKPSVIYYLKVGELYKIGITINLGSRLRSIKKNSKKLVEVIDTHLCTLLEAYTMEQEILSRFSDYRTARSWSTELFDRDVLGTSGILGQKDDNEN